MRRVVFNERSSLKHFQWLFFLTHVPKTAGFRAARKVKFEVEKFDDFRRSAAMLRDHVPMAVRFKLPDVDVVHPTPRTSFEIEIENPRRVDTGRHAVGKSVCNSTRHTVADVGGPTRQ